MTPLKHRVPVLVPFLAVVCLTTGPGCARRSETLQLADLTSTEKLYVERFITLERARAVALADPDRGDVLLDSLGRVWSDSALEWTLHTLPKEPRRVAGMYDLLSRILNAENDSLVKAPLPRRLRAPLPDPRPLSAR